MAKNNPGIGADITGSLSAEESAALEADRNNPEPVVKSNDTGNLPDPAPQPDPVPASATPDPAAQVPDPVAQPTPTAAPVIPEAKVPLAALHEERQRRKEVEQQNALLQQRTNAILENMARQAAPQQVQPPAPELPDPNKDPAGYILAVLDAQQKKIDALTSGTTQQQQTTQQMTVLQQVQRRAEFMENEYKKATPDYENAVAYLRQSREAELIALGYSDPMARQSQLSQDLMGIAITAAQQNTNPAEIVYNMAKGRGYGVAPATPAPALAAPPTPAAPAAPATPQPNLTTVAAGQQQAAVSLSGTPGTAPAKVTAKTLLEMSPADFDKFMNDSGNRRQFMGD